MKIKEFLLSDSLYIYMTEKFLKEIYIDDYNKFILSLERSQSFIVDETQRYLEIFLQEDNGKELLHSKITIEKLNNAVAAKLVELIKNPEFNYLQRLIKEPYPTPEPFIIATSMVLESKIVIDASSRDSARLKSLCDKFSIEYLNIADYLKEIRQLE